LGQPTIPIMITRMRCTMLGSVRMADATSVCEPMMSTLRRSIGEKRFDCSIRNRTPSLSLGLSGAAMGPSEPASTGGWFAMPRRFSRASRIVSRAFAAVSWFLAWLPMRPSASISGEMAR